MKNDIIFLALCCKLKIRQSKTGKSAVVYLYSGGKIYYDMIKNTKKSLIQEEIT